MRRNSKKKPRKGFNPSSSFMLQKTETDCGPTSVYNALVWLGCNPNQAIYDRLLKICKTDHEGTFTPDMNRALRWAAKKWKFSCEYRPYATATEITNHIKKGGSAILGHNTPWELPPVPHYSFWFDFEDGNVLGANVKWRRLYAYVTTFQLRWIARTDGDVWLLKRELDE